MHAWVQTGKAGDILCLLPALKIRADYSGEPQNLVVSRQYESVVANLDYIRPVPIDLHWQDLRGAIQWAKKRFDSLTVPQLHGDATFKFDRRRPSFVLDMWDRAGHLCDFDQQPLQIPFVRSAGSKSIFFADYSESSPFFFKEDLAALIQKTFPEHQLVRASGIRLKHLRDFLPIMEQSDLIVSVETSFLHLSAACSKPVIAFVADRPDPWRGTPWQKRFALHCRYKDFESRQDEIVAAMNRAVNKVRIPEPIIMPVERPNAYNMTFAKGVNISRYHRGSWQTKLAIEDGSGTQDILFPPECDDVSMEDARAFHFGGKLHIAYTVAKAVDNEFRCIQAYGPLEKVNGVWMVTKHLVPVVKRNDFSGMHKNWVFFERGSKLYFIFGVNGTTQLVGEVMGEKVVNNYESDAPKWKWGEVRGGAVAPYRNHLLRIFHSRLGSGHKHYDFRYYIGAALMEPEPPFRTVAISGFPILAGNEKYVDAKFWKPSCYLPYGLSVEGDDITVSGGQNDSLSFVLKLKPSDLNL